MKRGGPRHPKMSRLAAALHIEHYSAIGIVEALWHFTSDFAPQGDIGRFDDSDIARGVYWNGDSGALIEALVDCRFLDAVETPSRLLVHGWGEHCDEAVRKKLVRAKLSSSCDYKRVETPSRHVETPSAPHARKGVGVLSTSSTEKASMQRVVPLPEVGIASVNEKGRPAEEFSPPQNGNGKANSSSAVPVYDYGLSQSNGNGVNSPVLDFAAARRLNPSRASSRASPAPKSRFPEFWARYKLLRDAGDEDDTARVWISMGGDEHPGIFDCLTSFENSRDVQNGAVMSGPKFLWKCQSSNCNARWPEPKPVASQKTEYHDPYRRVGGQ